MRADHQLLIACLDLTGLGEDETEGTVEALCARAVRPVDREPALHVAAVCVWPRFVPLARGLLRDTPVRVASATGGFPLPEAPLADRLDEIRAAVDAGADEVDVPVARYLLDEPDALGGELRATREAAGTATWKAILETGALQREGIVVLAEAALDAGADFLKTSTGKGGVQGATPAAVEAIARLVASTAAATGIKVSGGVRGAGQAANYLELVRDVLGRRWPTPATFRIGASALLDALVA
jgi:deoxyribose-phosphate aldolase